MIGILKPVALQVPSLIGFFGSIFRSAPILFLRMLKNKYIKICIWLYGCWATYLYVLYAQSMDSDGGIYYRKVLRWIVWGLIFNSGLFVVTTAWAKKYRKIAVLTYLPTLLLMPNFLMLNHGIGVEMHLIITIVVFVLFLKGKKSETAAHIRS